jgi:hypothetical protein
LRVRRWRVALGASVSSRGKKESEDRVGSRELRAPLRARAALPHHAWRLVDWTHRGNRICILWQNDNRIGERTVTWRGVDWLTLRDGKIVEEVVHYDTAPLRALASGAAASPLLPF